jgi:hypothetical protein
MPNKTLDIEDLLETPDDPRFIGGIFNYCHRRCDRCAFTERCRLYADDAAQHPDTGWSVRVHPSIQRTFDLVKRWCARQGIDAGAGDGGAPSEAVAAAFRLSDETRLDPLQKLAERYTFSAVKIADALRRAPVSHTWPPDAREALETIEWFVIRVSSKVHRALLGYRRRLDIDLGPDPVQSDWNGSAKVARLEIAASRAAWATILRAGDAPADSPLRRMIGLLDELDAGVAERFPDAMAFVRPGFDDGR